MITSCETPAAELEAIETIGNSNDFTTLYSMRYRLESDPDVDASYTPVVTTQTAGDITYPYFDISAVDPGTYVVHTYLTSDGSTTGTKMIIIVECYDDLA